MVIFMCALGKRVCTIVFGGLIGPHGMGPMIHPLGSNGPEPITFKLRSNNTNNRTYFHNIIFHYLKSKDIPHRRLNINTINIIHMT